jgi:Cdc6-like AAA superfamily ATPase
LKTKIINLYGPPGVGKSTLAADIYSYLKRKDRSVELVREVAKDYVYLGKKPNEIDQLTINVNQMANEYIKYGKVEYIVTDCPYLLPAFYYSYNHGLTTAMTNIQLMNKLRNDLDVSSLNFYLPFHNSHYYKQEGRFENSVESNVIDNQLIDFLNMYDEKFTLLPVCRVSQFDIILRQLEKEFGQL